MLLAVIVSSVLVYMYHDGNKDTLTKCAFVPFLAIHYLFTCVYVFVLVCKFVSMIISSIGFFL